MTLHKVFGKILCIIEIERHVQIDLVAKMWTDVEGCYLLSPNLQASHIALMRAYWKNFQDFWTGMALFPDIFMSNSKQL